jgi:hypothetical protein
MASRLERSKGKSSLRRLGFMEIVIESGMTDPYLDLAKRLQSLFDKYPSCNVVILNEPLLIKALGTGDHTNKWKNHQTNKINGHFLKIGNGLRLVKITSKAYYLIRINGEPLILAESVIESLREQNLY